MRSKEIISCKECADKYICPHAASGNYCGAKNGETRQAVAKAVRESEVK